MTINLHVRGALVPLFLLACLLLGGSTRSVVPNLLLQLGAILILAWAALAKPRIQSGEPGRKLMLLVLAVIVIVILQLFPLPPAVWTALPGREAVARGFDLMGQARPWLPLSLTPYDTMTSALWLLPPLAIMAGMLRLGAYREAWLAGALGLAALAGTLLGVLQVTSGDVLTSAWYLYPITNNGQAAGFFANSNHMGTLLVVAIPFLLAMLAGGRGRAARARGNAGTLAMLAGAMLILIIGVVLNGSMAALGLGVAVLAASLLLRVPMTEKWARWGISGAGLVAVAAMVAIFASSLASLSPASTAQSTSTRAMSFGNSLRATADAFPIGTGSGSFPSVYPAYENPDVVDRWFVNHVHNDYIELAMETGLVGILLLLATILWWVGRTIAIWRAPTIDHFARAATIASGAILAHSAVDFPLRTTAIAAVFAMCMALMAGPRRLIRTEPVTRIGEGGARHLSID